MREEPDDRDLIIIDEAALPHGLARWLPTTVVLAAVAGFMALAWYAYHAGTQSVKDDDLLVVEADKTPLKEKPADPGGMKFPDQDKTIFDTFSGKQDAPPKVERVLPAPEEPMPAQLDTSGTTTWINRDLHKDSGGDKAAARPEQVIPAVPAEAKKPVATQLAAATPPAPQHDVVAEKSPKEDDAVATYRAALEPSATATAPKPEQSAAKPEPLPAARPEQPAAKAAPPKKFSPPKAEIPATKPAAAADGGVAVQLGAYRSEGEAHTAWAKMVRKNADLLSGRERLIIKADLGARGIYYRLRVPGFGSVVEAKAFCDRLAARKQACILPTGK